MIRRPLFVGFLVWALGAFLLFNLGVSLERQTSLDLALGSGSSEATIKGKVINVRQGEYGRVLSLDTCSVFLGDGEELETHGLIVYYNNETDVCPGDRVLVKGIIKPFPEPDNPGEFNRRRYYRISGFDYQVSGSELAVVAHENGVGALLYKVKNELTGAIDSVAVDENEAGLFKAILLGDRTGLDDETYELFKISGIAHILAISGLHLTLVATAVLSILKRLRVPHIAAALIADSLLLFYVLMIDGSSSAIRALIMFTLSLIAPLIGRTYDMLSALALSGLLMLIDTPLLVADGGFQLSFGAIMSIGIIYPVLSSAFNYPAKKVNKLKISDFLKSDKKTDSYGKAKQEYKTSEIKEELKSRLTGWVIRPLLLSFSIQIGTLPVVAHNYFTVTPYGIILNLLALPLVSIAMLSVALAAVGGLVYQPLGIFLAGAAHMVFSGLIEICRLVSKLPGASLVFGDPDFFEVLLYYIILGLVVFYCKRRTKKVSVRSRKAPDLKLGLGAVIVIIMNIFWMLPPGTLPASINALYVGQGDSTVIFGAEGECVLVDCGSSDKQDVAGSVILPFIKSKGENKIDLIFLSHGDKDHVSGLEELLKDPAVSVEALALSRLSTAALSGESYQEWEEVLGLAEKYDVPVYYPDAGDELKVGTLEFETVSPSSKTLFEDENDNSMVLLLKYGEFKGLFAGDISSTAEDILVDYEHLGEVDYLKCPHHGSRFSSSAAFLKTLSPKVVTVSAGKNNVYGHPSEVTLLRVKEAGADCFRTDLAGAVSISLTKTGIKEVSCFKST